MGHTRLATGAKKQVGFHHRSEVVDVIIKGRKTVDPVIETDFC